MSSKLQSLFKIENTVERQKALMEYAQSLGVNMARAQNPGGDVTEDELAVLIYDAEQMRRTEQSKKIGIAMGILIGLVMFGAALALAYFFLSRR